ncbi:MAG: hypothetical protein AB2813_14550 [Candidatus Sedimenticola endophacoides]
MNNLAKELIRLHGTEGLRAEQWFDLILDDVMAGFGKRLAEHEIPKKPVREVLFTLSGLYAKEVIPPRRLPTSWGRSTWSWSPGTTRRVPASFSRRSRLPVCWPP